MGIIPPPKQATSPALKRRSGQLDFSNLGPLKTTGTVGFTAFRDKESQARRKKARKNNGAPGIPSSAMDADSDDDDDDEHIGDSEDLSKMDDVDAKYDPSKLGPEDAKHTGELAEGVNRIRVCAYPSPPPPDSCVHGCIG